MNPGNDIGVVREYEPTGVPFLVFGAAPLAGELSGSMVYAFYRLLESPESIATTTRIHARVHVFVNADNGQNLGYS